jgi:hypothetical protein
MKTRSNKDRRKAAQTVAPLLSAPPGGSVNTPDLKIQLGLVAEADVAALQDMTIASLRNQRAREPYTGPPYQRVGKKIFYPLDQLKKYLAASTVTPSRSRTLIDGDGKRGARSGAAA